MADQSTPKPMASLTNREQEIVIAALGKCLKSGDIQIDYAKLATETGLKDAKSATAVWNPIKKKLFGIASAQSSTAAGAANKVTKPKTPCKPKELKEPKTPASTTKATKSTVKVKEEENEAASDEEAIDDETGVQEETNLTNGAESSPASKVETINDEEPTAKDADGDSTLVDIPESVERGKGQVSIADDMSAGDMSPPTTPALTKAKKAVSPKGKAALKTPKTPKTLTGEATSTGPDDASEAPISASSGGKKRGRKTNAQKEAEAATSGKVGAVENGDGDGEQKPAKKLRKTPVKRAKKEEDAKDGEAAGNVEGDDDDVGTPAKKPRKTPVKTSKGEASSKNGDSTNADADDGEVRQTDKPIVKPRQALIKEENKEDAAAAGEESPIGEVVKEKRKPGPKPAAAMAKKAATTVEQGRPDVAKEEAEQAKIDGEAAVKIVEAAELANEVLAGKKIQTKVASTTDAIGPRRNWGTPVNGHSPSPLKGQAVVQLGTKVVAATGTTNDEAEGYVIVVASEVVESIEKDDDEDGDTITVATA